MKTKQPYHIVANRQTLHTETWAYGGYEDYHIDPITKIYIGDDKVAIEKFFEEYCYMTLRDWYESGYNIFYDLLKCNELYIKDSTAISTAIAELLRLVYFDVRPLLNQDGSYNNDLDENYLGDGNICHEFCADVPTSFFGNVCHSTIIRYVNKRLEENEQREILLKEQKKQQEVKERETQRRLYESLKAQFETVGEN